ncbi:MAG TPA: helix-turn-helix domain-containing protein [Candidatus Tetragenococcus pullicola]|nr:helix-turn-helix domain-containing protein [Candidatus Tetragenococcus pullicola]
MGNEILIGERLRKARLNKNISLDELQQKSKIQKRYLESIERGQFESLPGEYYIRSFIRQYATVVGEDGDFLVEVLDGKKSLGPTPAKRPEPEKVEGSRTALHDEKDRNKKVLNALPMILLGLIALTIVMIVGYMMWQDSHSTPLIQTTATSISIDQKQTTETEQTSSLTTSSSEKTSETSSSEEKKMTVKLSDTTADSATITLTNVKEPLKLTFKGKEGRCWVGVMPNGANDFTYQKTFEPGAEDTMTLPEETKSFLISLGASAYIEIEANGEKVAFSDPKFEDLQKKLNVNVSYLE